MKKFILVALLFSAALQISAHALWIETAPGGKKGVSQEVKIFYGEYSEFKPEQVKDWYSDVKEFNLWLVKPDNQKIQLTTTAGDNHFTSSFIPEADGNYTLLISHDAKDLGRTTLYQFNTSASVTVGKNDTHGLIANANPLKFSVTGSQLKKPVTIQGFFKDAVSEKLSVTIFSPSGWTKQVTADAQGKASFIPDWKGKYMIEVSRSDDDKGEHYGKAYSGIWRCATYFIEVK